MKEDNGRTAENGGRTVAVEEEASMAGGGGENGVFWGKKRGGRSISVRRV
jgi:hypothetical protein